ncbi:MAG: ATP-binding cassette domain-containing protein [Dysosmobacter sp.]
MRFKVGLVFQYPEYQLFEETVYKDIAFGPKNMGLDAEEIDRRVRDAAAFAGTARGRCWTSRSFELSGGQKRRVAIAGVIAMEPKVLVLDEPTAGLDPQGRDTILAQIQAYHRAQGRDGGAGEPQHGGDRQKRGPHRCAVRRKGIYGGRAEAGVCPGA